MTDTGAGLAQTISMKEDDAPRIVEAERIADGVIVTFEDGMCAVYSASLLYASRGLATIMSDVSCDDVTEPAKKREADGSKQD